MAGRKNTNTQAEFQEPPPRSPEEWENRLTAKAFRAVEERIDNGTASATELCWFLRVGSQKQREEIKKLQEENALLRAKTSMIETEKDRAGLYREVIDALAAYRTETTDVPFDPIIY